MPFKISDCNKFLSTTPVTALADHLTKWTYIFSSLYNMIDQES